jgi:hypothetical protein
MTKIRLLDRRLISITSMKVDIYGYEQFRADEDLSVCDTKSEGDLRAGDRCVISTCRIGRNGLRYAARAVGETEPLYVLPGGTPLDAKIDESAKPVCVRSELSGSDSTRKPDCKNPSSFRAGLAVAQYDDSCARPRTGNTRRLIPIATSFHGGSRGTSKLDDWSP